MKISYLTVLFLLCVKFVFPQKVGIEFNADVNNSNSKLIRIVDLSNAPNPNNKDQRLNEFYIANPRIQVLSASVYYETLKKFKLSFYFQYARKLVGNFNRKYTEGDNSANPTDEFFFSSFAYSCKDYGLIFEKAIRRKKKISFSLHGKVDYKTRFKLRKYQSSNESVSSGYEVVDDFIEKTGGFYSLGGGIGLHYKNFSLLSGYMNNITKIQHMDDPYIKNYGCYYFTLKYSILSKRIGAKDSKTNANFNFRNASKIKYFVEFSQPVFNEIKSEGFEAYYATDPSTWNTTALGEDGTMFILETAPKVKRLPCINGGIAYNISGNVDLLFKVGGGYYTFKYENAMYTVAETGGTSPREYQISQEGMNLRYFSLLLSQGVRYNNLFSYKKYNLFCSAYLNEKVFKYLSDRDNSSEYAVPSVIKPLFFTLSADIGINKQNNAVSIGYENSITSLNARGSDYKLKRLHSITLSFSHKF